MEQVSGRGVAAADGLGAEAGAEAIKAGGENASVVQNDNIARAEEIGEIAEVAVEIFAGFALQVQHAGTVAGGKWLLGDEFFRQVEVEVGD